MATVAAYIAKAGAKRLNPVPYVSTVADSCLRQLVLTKFATSSPNISNVHLKDSNRFQNLQL